MLKFIFLLMSLFVLKNLFWKYQNLLLIIMLGYLIFMAPSLYGNVMFNYYLDFLSYGMILLSFWITFLMVMASEKFNFMQNNSLFCVFFMLLLLLFLYLSFICMNLLMFYLFFEMSLIPTFYLIMGWGYQPERLQAGLYLLFYTLFASLPLLIGIWFLFFQLNLMNFNMLIYLSHFNVYFYLFMFLAFLVKMPMFLVHLWLPKAHVEAPVFGSMILAGILLKLGGYGLIRMFTFFYINFFNISIYWMSISMIGSILVSLNCLWQIDMKSLIAYSSVVHMGLILIAIFNFSYLSISNCYLMMIGHGLCSSGLFCLANLSYDRSMSRSMMINKGMLNLMPSMSLWWFLLCTSNMSAPPSLNLLSEINLLNSILNWSIFMFILLMFFSFFSASYCLYLFSFSQHGNLFSLMFSYSNNNFREFLVIFLHWIPLNLFFLKGEYFIFWF